MEADPARSKSRSSHATAGLNAAVQEFLNDHDNDSVCNTDGEEHGNTLTRKSPSLTNGDKLKSTQITSNMNDTSGNRTASGVRDNKKVPVEPQHSPTHGGKWKTSRRLSRRAVKSTERTANPTPDRNNSYALSSSFGVRKHDGEDEKAGLKKPSLNEDVQATPRRESGDKKSTDPSAQEETGWRLQGQAFTDLSLHCREEKQQAKTPADDAEAENLTKEASSKPTAISNAACNLQETQLENEKNMHPMEPPVKSSSSGQRASNKSKDAGLMHISLPKIPKSNLRRPVVSKCELNKHTNPHASTPLLRKNGDGESVVNSGTIIPDSECRLANSQITPLGLAHGLLFEPTGEAKRGPETQRTPPESQNRKDNPQVSNGTSTVKSAPDGAIKHPRSPGIASHNASHSSGGDHVSDSGDQCKPEQGNCVDELLTSGHINQKQPGRVSDSGDVPEVEAKQPVVSRTHSSMVVGTETQMFMSQADDGIDVQALLEGVGNLADELCGDGELPQARQRNETSQAAEGPAAPISTPAEDKSECVQPESKSDPPKPPDDPISNAGTEEKDQAQCDNTGCESEGKVPGSTPEPQVAGKQPDRGRSDAGAQGQAPAQPCNGKQPSSPSKPSSSFRLRRMPWDKRKRSSVQEKQQTADEAVTVTASGSTVAKRSKPVEQGDSVQGSKRRSMVPVTPDKAQEHPRTPPSVARTPVLATGRQATSSPVPDSLRSTKLAEISARCSNEKILGKRQQRRKKRARQVSDAPDAADAAPHAECKAQPGVSKRLKRSQLGDDQLGREAQKPSPSHRGTRSQQLICATPGRTRSGDSCRIKSMSYGSYDKSHCKQPIVLLSTCAAPFYRLHDFFDRRRLRCWCCSGVRLTKKLLKQAQAANIAIKQHSSGEIVTEFTHFVVEELVMSVHALIALADGRPILGMNWLMRCFDVGAAVPVKGMLLNDTKAERKHKFSMIQSFNSACSRRLLEGVMSVAAVPRSMERS